MADQNNTQDPNPIIAWAVRSMQQKIDKARAQRVQEQQTTATMTAITKVAS